MVGSERQGTRARVDCVSRRIRQRPRLYGDELQPRYSNGEAIRGMVFKLGGRLPNMETWTLSPGAPETRRGLFLSSPLRLGLVAVFGKHGLDAL
jgi:hypothetical protein